MLFNIFNIYSESLLMKTFSVLDTIIIKYFIFNSSLTNKN